MGRPPVSPGASLSLQPGLMSGTLRLPFPVCSCTSRSVLLGGGLAHSAELLQRMPAVPADAKPSSASIRVEENLADTYLRELLVRASCACRHFLFVALPTFAPPPPPPLFACTPRPIALPPFEYPPPPCPSLPALAGESVGRQASMASASDDEVRAPFISCHRRPRALPPPHLSASFALSRVRSDISQSRLPGADVDARVLLKTTRGRHILGAHPRVLPGTPRPLAVSRVAAICSVIIITEQPDRADSLHILTLHPLLKVPLLPPRSEAAIKVGVP